MWEQRYQFIKPCRSETNIRYYCTEELELLLDVALLNKTGYRISQINDLDRKDLRKKASRLPDANHRLDNRVNEMTIAMIAADTERFQDILNQYSEECGMDQTISELIYRFLVKTGMMWQTGQLPEASRKLASHLIRQKLVVGIELAVPKEKNNETVLLFLPEGDHEETGLLYSNYVLKMRGYDTIYLGGNVPIGDLCHIVEEKKPKQIFMHIVNGEKQVRPDRFLQQLFKKLPSPGIILSGKPDHLPASIPSNVRIINEVSELFTS
jgi:methanogenic corrinoid protein MtbC1